MRLALFVFVVLSAAACSPPCRDRGACYTAIVSLDGGVSDTSDDAGQVVE